MQSKDTAIFRIVQFETTDQALPTRAEYRITITHEQRVALTPRDGYLPTDEELRQAIERTTAALHKALPIWLRDHLATIQQEKRREALGIEQDALDEDDDEDFIDPDDIEVDDHGDGDDINYGDFDDDDEDFIDPMPHMSVGGE